MYVCLYISRHIHTFTYFNLHQAVWTMLAIAAPEQIKDFADPYASLHIYTDECVV